MLAALRCPDCTAPVRDLAKCVYCGAALSLASSAAGGGRTEEHYSVRLRVGPSNVERVVRLLKDHLGLDPAEARARLATPPAELDLGDGAERAYAIMSALSEGGAQAEVIPRKVVIPLRTVTLESAGPRELAVIVALRAEIELTIPEAKRIVAETPCVIATGVDDAFARTLVASLQAAGATARLA